MFKFFALCFCLSLSTLMLAQNGIQTGNHEGIEDLVKNVFIKGNCSNVSNISAVGNEIISIGQFENGEKIIKINDGIILCTGDIALAQGPNENSGASLDLNVESADLDLNVLATDIIYDATGIEFDFVPLGNNVTFKYVFASEEYCEFVGTSFNDVFGFFVSGPGINGSFADNAINVATLFTTDEDVSINTINHIDNTEFYVDNVTNLDAEACDNVFNPIYEDSIEYDGFTIPLTATFPVIPCETYHIRLIIGDVGDSFLDSGVFLESKSFDLGEEIIVLAEVPGRTEPIAYESCVDGQFVFYRNDLSTINQDFTIEYSISPESEAINGVDFVEIPLSITIPAGDKSVILPITIIEDNIIEGPEKLKLELMYDCNCIAPTKSELIITEASDLSANFEDISVCADQTFSITPDIVGGVLPYSFLWGTGDVSKTFQSTITQATQYTVTITDFCGNTSTALADVDVQDIPTATLAGVYNLCETNNSGIPVELEGNPPWSIGYSIDGVEQEAIENILSSPFYLNTPTDGIYEITAFNDIYCTGAVSGSAIVESPFDLELDIVHPSCFNSFDGSIAISQFNAASPFSIDWSIETEDDFLLDSLMEGSYTVSIVDGDSCFYEKTIDLIGISNDIIDCVPIYIPNTFSPNNDGLNDAFSIFFDPQIGIKNIISFQVYNRWGALMFEQKNFLPENGATKWKGQFKGKDLNPGVYVYKIMLAYENGQTRLMSGDINLIR